MTIIETVPTTPFNDQRPGTSGLRKKVHTFQQTNYVENFVQSIFDSMILREGAILVVGGDGRYYNQEAIQKVLKIAIANGFARIIVGRNGLLSTPSASHLIRAKGAAGGLLLSASHNPGGPDGDFGIKCNLQNGGAAPEAFTDQVFARSQSISAYRIAIAPDVDLALLGASRLGDTEIEIVDPVVDYVKLLETLFDFGEVRGLFQSGFRFSFDAMSAVTGPYAHAIFEDLLGAAKGSVINGTPMTDFGGGHPDPNQFYLKRFFGAAMSADGPDLSAASDGDGDRNLIIGRSCFVSPSDSLAVIAANAHLTPGYSRGLVGIARSMPTSYAADRVANKLQIPLYETPTGWKYFGNLLDAGRVTICGEESAGTGSDHIREKDGLWAVLMWLNIVAIRRQSVAEIMRQHWAEFGRNFYARHDYEGLEVERAGALIAGLREKLPKLTGQRFNQFVVQTADEFAYLDPVDGVTVRHQGIRLLFECGSRAVFRLSGTGTSGATLRVYLERFETDPALSGMDLTAALEPVSEVASYVAAIEHFTGRTSPTLIT